MTMTSLLPRLVAAAELAVKKTLFDCRACGQCVLQRTSFVCPMTCPKGLRNGPCGGTLAERCEVHPDHPCVWVRIDRGRHGDVLTTPPLLDAPDPALFGTASWLNAVSGADRAARTPLAWLDLGRDRIAAPVRTASHLERRLKNGAFVWTAEVRAPRIASTEKPVAHGRSLIKAGFDAINATSFVRGRPALPSGTVAAALQGGGVEAIAQVTGRDFTRTGLIGEMLALQRSGVHNLLCLTGDAWHGGVAPRAVFEMDSSLMLYEARWLAERREVRFSADAMPQPPRPFLGCVINPGSDPIETPVRRLLQKSAAGADFIQTQAITDIGRLKAFVSRCRDAGITRELFFIIGIPVVTSRSALNAMPKIPGMQVDPDFRSRLEGASDIAAEGVAAARDLARSCAEILGVRGIHLMMFGGGDHSVIAAVRDGLDFTPVRDGPVGAVA
jgi:methylenetetrahydrofolate reductase (NADPH)